MEKNAKGIKPTCLYVTNNFLSRIEIALLNQNQNPNMNSSQCKCLVRKLDTEASTSASEHLKMLLCTTCSWVTGEWLEVIGDMTRVTSLSGYSTTHEVSRGFYDFQFYL